MQAERVAGKHGFDRRGKRQGVIPALHVPKSQIDAVDTGDFGRRTQVAGV